MKKQLYAIPFVLILFLTAGCESNTQSNSSKIDNQIVTEEEAEKTLNQLMLVFGDRMEKYLENGEKDLKELENLHLDFVPILRWNEYEGDETYKEAALSAGLIVHQLEDLSGEEYESLLTTLKPAYEKFYSKYGE